jgi:uncharacterized protein (UPF0332 family)
MSDDSKKISQNLLARAEEAEKAGVILLEQKLTTSAIREFYHAMILSVTAALVLINVRAHNHRAVISQFYKDILNKHEMEEKWGKILQEVYGYNQAIDLELAGIPDDKGIEKMVSDCAGLISELKKWMKAQ